MALIAGTDKKLNATQISEQFNFSKNHSAKILQILVKSGFLSSTRGPTGGFKLNVDPGKTSLLDIYQLIEGKINGKMCNMCVDDCIFEPCIYGDLGERVRNDVKDYLKGTTIQELKTKLKLKNKD
jgi:Rrf2 family protein